MSEIEEKLKKTIDEESKKMVNNNKLRSSQAYYNRLKKKGLISPQKYSIPPIDTIGRRLFELTSLANQVNYKENPTGHLNKMS